MDPFPIPNPDATFWVCAREVYLLGSQLPVPLLQNAGVPQQSSCSLQSEKKSSLDFNPLKPNEISNSYQLDQSIPILRVVGRYFFIFIQFLIIEYSVSNSGDPDQTPHSPASDLGMHCLPMSHKKGARRIWVIVAEMSSYIIKVSTSIIIIA